MLTRRGFLGRLAAGLAGLAVAPSLTRLLPEPVAFGPLSSIIAATPTTVTIGGISRATYTFWRNQDATAIGSACDHLSDEMRRVWETCE